MNEKFTKIRKNFKKFSVDKKKVARKNKKVTEK